MAKERRPEPSSPASLPHIKVSEEAHRNVKVYVARKGGTIGKVTEEAIKEYLKKRGAWEDEPS